MASRYEEFKAKALKQGGRVIGARDGSIDATCIFQKDLGAFNPLPEGEVRCFTQFEFNSLSSQAQERMINGRLSAFFEPLPDPISIGKGLGAISLPIIAVLVAIGFSRK